MALENVIIKITTKAGTQEIRAVRRELLAMAAAGELGDTTMLDMARAFDMADRKARSLRKNLTSMGRALSSLNKIAIKLFTIGFALGAAALATNNALFAVGRQLVNAYTWAMQGLAAVVAAVGAGVATAAAAFREYNAAVNAYAFKSSPTLKNRLAESSAALRNIEEDATLATFGVQALNQAFAAVAKNTQVTGTSKALLRGLADFAAASGDPARGIAAAGEFVGLLQKSGKLDAQAIAAAQGIGPAFVDALEKARKSGVQTLDQFRSMLESGALARLAGIEGQAGIVGQTVVGQFKAMMVNLKNVTADFGQILLGPFKTFLDESFRIFRRTLSRIGPEAIGFGRGTMFDGLLGAMVKVEDLIVKLFRKYLPGVNGMMERFKRVWNDVVLFTKDIVDRLRGLLPIGRAVIEAFGDPFVKIFTLLGEWIKYVGKAVEDNQDRYNQFGQDLLSFLQKLEDTGKRFIDVFTEALPALGRILGWAERLLDVFLKILSVVGGLIDKLSGLPGIRGLGLEGLGGMAQMFGMLAAGGAIRGRAAKLRGMPVPAWATFGTFVANNLKRAGGLGGRLLSGGSGLFMSQAGGGFRQRYRTARSGTPGYGISSGGSSMFPGEMGKGRIASFIDSFAPLMYLDRRLRLIKTAGTAMEKLRQSRTNMMTRLGRGGLGMPMILGSMFASPEAQGSLMQGGMLASMAPLLGKAGPYAALAGVGLAGYGIFKNARTAKGGALGGAMTGAAAGALVAGPIGAAIGAIGGAVVGYFRSRIRIEKQKAKEAAGKVIGQEMADIAKSLIAGDVEKMLGTIRAGRERIGELRTLRDTLRGLETRRFNTKTQEFDEFYDADKREKFDNRDEREKMIQRLVGAGVLTKEEGDGFIKAPEAFLDEMERIQNELDKVGSAMAKQFGQASQVAQRSFGLAADELQQLALQAGVNLADQTVSLRDKFIALGLAAEFTAEQINGAIRDITVQGMSEFEQRINRVASPAVINEMSEALYQDFIAGNEIDIGRMGEFVRSFFDQLNIMSPDTPLKNVQNLIRLLGPNGELFLPGGQLEGMGDVFRRPSSMVGQFGVSTQRDTAAALTDMIVRQSLMGGVSLDREQVASMLSSKNLGELERIQKALSSGVLNLDTLNTFYTSPAYKGAAQGYGPSMAEQGVSAIFSRLGLSGITFQKLDETALTIEEQTALYGEEGMAMINGFKRAIEESFANQPSWYNRNPEWYTAESFSALIAGQTPPASTRSQFAAPDENQDTSTPRGDTTSSRLGRTLARHNYFNSMLTGTRSITSSYRTSQLGSINSDHVMGKAYDLVGQNLGAYATMVNRSGGFAEFHGTGGARHLHVVPGEGPTGDATTPYMNKTVPAGSSNATTNYYSISVTGSPGMDVSALAQEVMSKIQKLERSSRERM